MSGDWRLWVKPSNDERCQALHIGASVLRARWPKLQADCSISVGPNMLTAHVALLWLGVVRVTMHHTGQLIAQSLPGQPFELDPSVLA